MRKTLVMVAIIAIASITLAGCKRGNQPQGTPVPTQKPRKVDKDINMEPLESRPFVELIPRDDGHAVTMKITEIKKQAQDLEYDIEYNSGSLVQGAFGDIPSLATLPITKEILLGSCSTGGKCTYNTDITGGILTLRFGTPDYTLKQEWSYTEKATKQTVFSSRDAKFALDITKAKITAANVIVYQTPGYPGTAPASVVAGPYVVSPAEKITGTVTVTMRLPTGTNSGSIAAWNGKTWTVLSSTVKDQAVKASGPMAQVYVVVAK